MREGGRERGWEREREMREWKGGRERERDRERDVAEHLFRKTGLVCLVLVHCYSWLREGERERDRGGRERKRERGGRGRGRER